MPGNCLRDVYEPHSSIRTLTCLYRDLWLAKTARGETVASFCSSDREAVQIAGPHRVSLSNEDRAPDDDDGSSYKAVQKKKSHGIL